MNNPKEIRVEDIEALARKLEGTPAIDDHDRDTLASVFVLAGMAISQAAEVTGFGLGACICTYDPENATLFQDRNCVMHSWAGYRLL